ncbi:MAG TPA: dehydrogenase [Rikenellaceae bacterium]|nr:dehydrogenase [Rikenellaceae bacterium]
MKKICVCGGGALGHVIAGWTVYKKLAQVSVLTGQPKLWSTSLFVDTPQGSVLKGSLSDVSDDPKRVVADADIVLFCYPGYVIENELLRLKPFFRKDAYVGAVFSSTGFFFEAKKILAPYQPLWGFQRVPFIARVEEYGHSAHLLGYKDELKVAVENVSQVEKQKFVEFLSEWFDVKVSLLNNYYEASLSNSNPILHPSRLYSLFGSENEGRVYSRDIYFYKEWNEESAELLIKMDKELFDLLKILPVHKGFLPTILDYYESHDAASLAAKLRSIPAFKDIKTPMRQTPFGWLPDYKSRYFTEDFPYGLRYICNLAHEKEVSVPIMDRVLSWGLSHIQSSQTALSPGQSVIV